MSANIRHSSENSEFMTPAWLTEWAHHVLGGVDLDPASSEQANRTVLASRIFTKENNGLFQNWWNLDGSPSRLFCNPPGGLVDECGREVVRAATRKGVRYPGCTESGACGLPAGHKHSGVESSAVFWWHKLMHEFEAGRVACGIFLGFSLELLQSAQTFAGKQPLDFPCCVPKQRIRFETEDESGARVPGEQPTHGNVIVLVTKDYKTAWKTASSGCDAAAEAATELVQRFTNTFEQIGYVHVPRGY